MGAAFLIGTIRRLHGLRMEGVGWNEGIRHWLIWMPLAILDGRAMVERQPHTQHGLKQSPKATRR